MLPTLLSPRVPKLSLLVPAHHSSIASNSKLWRSAFRQYQHRPRHEGPTLSIQRVVAPPAHHPRNRPLKTEADIEDSPPPKTSKAGGASDSLKVFFSRKISLEQADEFFGVGADQFLHTWDFQDGAFMEAAAGPLNYVEHNVEGDAWVGVAGSCPIQHVNSQSSSSESESIGSSHQSYYMQC